MIIMPIYEYKCENSGCGHITEVLFPKPNDYTLVDCEKCGLDAFRMPSLFNTRRGASAEEKQIDAAVGMLLDAIELEPYVDGMEMA